MFTLWIKINNFAIIKLQTKKKLQIVWKLIFFYTTSAYCRSIYVYANRLKLILWFKRIYICWVKINNIWITFNRVIEQTKLVCVFLIENNVEKTDGNTKKIFNNVKITLVRVSFLVLKVRYQNHVRTKNLQLLDFKKHKTKSHCFYV